MGDLVAKQREYFSGIRSNMAGGNWLDSTYNFRLSNLLKLQDAVVKHESKLFEALREDLGKSEFESVMTETAVTISEIKFAIKNLKKWIRPQRVSTPLAVFPAKSYIFNDPYGVALLISPWNYPVQLPLTPLVASIAAGNCNVLKLSELSPCSSAAVSDMLRDTFDEGYIACVNGGVDVATALLKERFDYICYTGSGRVGKIVMKAAAEHLTPLTLELGGKSPCIVDETADLDLAAKRIVWGKFINAGQTCIAPDYVLAHKDIVAELIEKMKEHIATFYSDDPINSPEYGKIINKPFFTRLVSMIDSSKTVFGGKYDEEKLKIEPTIMYPVTMSDLVMEEEIFGPILPIMTYEGIKDVVATIAHHPNPLALYVFTKGESLWHHLVQTVSFGGGCVNDTLTHLASPLLPFGGVGGSGMGIYHGKFGFETFSRKKSILDKADYFDVPLRYPPGGNKAKYLKKIL